MSVHITDLPRLRREYVQMARRFVTEAAAQGDQENASLMSREANIYELAELYWVTKDMARVALDASLDMPEWGLDSAPTRTGLIVFDGGLPGLPDYFAHDEPRVNAFNQEVQPPTARVDYLVWHITGGGIHIFYGAIGAYRSDTSAPLIGMGAYNLPNINGRHMQAGGPMDALSAYDQSYAPAVLWLLGATWQLMSQENVASARPQRIGEGGHVKRKPVTVTTISLRRMRTVDATGEGTRTYSHRWIVRGHWRQQRHGTGNSQVRTIWVPSYVKGPPGAPLLANEKVMVWRR